MFLRLCLLITNFLLGEKLKFCLCDFLQIYWNCFEHLNTRKYIYLQAHKKLTNISELTLFISMPYQHFHVKHWNKCLSSGRYNSKSCLMMFVVSVVSHLAVVDGIEKGHSDSSNLEEWCNSGTFGLDILVIPTPPGTAHCSSNSTGALVATAEPGTQFIQFHLSERNISCNSWTELWFFRYALLRNVIKDLPLP